MCPIFVTISNTQVEYSPEVGDSLCTSNAVGTLDHGSQQVATGSAKLSDADINALWSAPSQPTKEFLVGVLGLCTVLWQRNCVDTYAYS